MADFDGIVVRLGGVPLFSSLPGGIPSEEAFGSPKIEFPNDYKGVLLADPNFFAATVLEVQSNYNGVVMDTSADMVIGTLSEHSPSDHNGLVMDVGPDMKVSSSPVKNAEAFDAVLYVPKEK